MQHVILGTRPFWGYASLSIKLGCPFFRWEFFNTPYIMIRTLDSPRHPHESLKFLGAPFLSKHQVGALSPIFCDNLWILKTIPSPNIIHPHPVLTFNIPFVVYYTILEMFHMRAGGWGV